MIIQQENNGRSTLLKNCLVALLVALIVSACLWVRSDEPPYGFPDNELSNNYWGLIIDVAHKWRAMRFELWDRGVLGGLSLFTSSQYPLLNPTNAAAFFLNDAQFYKFKLIEPYFLGIFFGVLFFSRVMAAGLFLAVFGALLYMGLPLSRQTIMAESPIFLYTIGLFPAMLCAFVFALRHDLKLACALVGALIALQFLGAGSIQFPQLIIWWTVFLGVYCFFERKNWWSWGWRWMMSLGILLFMAVGLSAVQFIPTALFAIFESSRQPGYYDINSFPVFSSTAEFSLVKIIQRSILAPGGVSMRGIVAVILFLVAFVLIYARSKEHAARSFPLLKIMGVSAILYFSIPALAQWLSLFAPMVLGKILSPLSTFTFRYGAHVLDFILVAAMLGVLRDVGLYRLRDKRGGLLRILAAIVVVAGVFFGFAPLVVSGPALQYLGSAAGTVLFFTCESVKSALVVAAAVLTVGIYLFVPWIRARLQSLFIVALIAMAFMTFITCYNWNDKGRRNHYSEYAMDAPEHIWYRNAKDKYYVPYQAPEYMVNDYALLYGVRGLSGFMPVPSMRISNFFSAYGRKAPEKAKRANAILTLTEPAGALATYFPIDFTSIVHGQELPWPGFRKEVDGVSYDIWAREQDAPKLLFADRVEVCDFVEIMRGFNRPFAGVLWVETADATVFSMKDGVLSPRAGPPKVLHWSRLHEDQIFFRIDSSREVFVIVPEMYQAGWRLFVNGKRAQLFPANYIFSGFYLPAGGVYDVSLSFVPRGYSLGLVMNVVAFAVFIGMVVFYWRKISRLR